MPAHAWGIFAVAALAAVQSRHPVHALAPAAGPVTSSAWASAATARLWVAYGGLAWVAASLLRSRRRSALAVRTLFVAGTAVAVLGIIQKGSGADSFYGLRVIPPGFLAFGPYFYRNHAGGLLAMTFALGTGLLLSRHAAYAGPRRIGALAEFWSTQAVLVASLAAQGIALWMCESRGAFHSLVGGAVVLGLLAAWAAPPRNRTRWGAALLVAVAAYLALVISVPQLVDVSGAGGLGRSMRGRLAIWNVSWTLVRERPAFGFGLGAYQYAYAPFQPATADVGGVVEHAHAEWMELICTGGVAGVALYGAGLLVQLVAAVRWWWGWQEPPQRRLLGGALAATVIFIVHGLADLNFQSPANAAVFLVVSVLVFPRRPRGAAEAEQPQAAAGWPGRAALLGAAVWGLVGAARLGGGWWCASRAVGADLGDRVRWFSRALRCDPGHPGYERELGVACLWLAEEQPAARRLLAREALAAAVAGLRWTPDHPGLLEVGGVALWRLGRTREGQRFLAAARALQPWRRPPRREGDPGPGGMVH